MAGGWGKRLSGADIATIEFNPCINVPLISHCKPERINVLMISHGKAERVKA